MSVGWNPWSNGINTCGGGVSGLSWRGMDFKVVGTSRNRHKEKFEITADKVRLYIDMLDGNGYQLVREGTGSFLGRTGHIGFGDHCVRGVRIHSVEINGGAGAGTAEDCSGWDAVTVQECRERCRLHAMAPYCPRKYCAAAVFSPGEGGTGSCHLFDRCPGFQLASAGTVLLKEDLPGDSTCNPRNPGQKSAVEGREKYFQ